MSVRCSIFYHPVLLLAMLLDCGVVWADGDRTYEKQGERPAHLLPPPAPALSPEEALASFDVAPGFEIELVAFEPLIEDPVAMEFDTQGRLWVVEMRGFMQDIQATGQFEPVGRVSVCLDEDGDGVTDRSVVFADGLVLPRSIRLVADGVLVAEHEKLWFMRDLTGDLVANEKILVDPKYATSGSVEHRPNGLLLALDNWIYNGKSDKRYRFSEDCWEIGTTEQRGQWGIAQDNWGRLFYNFNWSQLHADLAPPNTLSRHPHFTSTLATNVAISNDQRVFPIRMNTGVNRGYRPGVLDEKGRLIAFASACSPWIYRGDAFPQEFHGNAFVCAPGANTIKRNIVSIDGLRVTAENGYPDRDFLASTDERFRPVALSGGPDGSLYVVDMYRGIIQQAEFMTSFLKAECEERELATPIHLGRIYRIRPEKFGAYSPPVFPEDDPTALVTLLQHPNGWWRDRAQQQIIRLHATEAILPLEELTRGDNPVAAAHALYALEGLGMLKPALLLELIDHHDARLAGIALRLSAASGSNDWLGELDRIDESDEGRAFSLAIALGSKPEEECTSHLFRLASLHAESPLVRDAIVSGLQRRELVFLRLAAAAPEWQESSPGRHALLQAVAATTARSEDPERIAALLELTSGDSWQATALLDGSVAGLMELEDAPTLTFAPKGPTDRLAPFLNWPGHVSPGYKVASASSQDAKVLSKSERQAFAKGQTLYANLCASCHGPDGRGLPPLAPPLRQSEWVTGDPDRLIKILLHGLEGPIQVRGKEYGPPAVLPAMPPVGMMADKDIAAILTYVRRAWGHGADPVSSGEVRRVRDLNVERRTAWTVVELAGPSNAAERE